MYCFAGRVPTLQEGNRMENIFSFPWSKDSPIVLGPRFKDAFQDPNSYLAIKPIFEKEKYIVTYNPSKGNIYALLKDQAKSDDILKAAFHAHVLLHIIHSSNQNQPPYKKHRETDHSVEQLHKIFKLCGSPSEEYWRKSKLPHATIFKPQQPYRRCVADTFKDFPAQALELMETLLSIDPADRGSAASALHSEV
ncbi:protein root UVB sensitive 6-like [Camellia sinensis]|uniref:protein root UVB sensitive 6-like n=1 Tax=Camellia sinensis TaxID=4442 RepID=UPI0010362CEA|nr:protein root UVB sensitive 6-like [Camellia sinensis]